MTKNNLYNNYKMLLAINFSLCPFDIELGFQIVVLELWKKSELISSDAYAFDLTDDNHMTIAIFLVKKSKIIILVEEMYWRWEKTSLKYSLVQIIKVL